MTRGFSVLCPVDFSEYSQAHSATARPWPAFRRQSHHRDRQRSPSFRGGGDADGADLAQNIERELRQFVSQAFQHGKPPPDPQFVTPVGKPTEEILRLAREHASEHIVMSSHGLTGLRKFFFGATTERVLRETTIPVLVTPGEHVAPKDLTELKGTGRPVLVPVDLSDAGLRQVKIAGAIADASVCPSSLHVIEPFDIGSRAHVTSECGRGRRSKGDGASSAGVNPERRQARSVDCLHPAEVAKIA
jgi:nucleotide-binding universal stress UspA family protein